MSHQIRCKCNQMGFTAEETKTATWPVPTRVSMLQMHTWSTSRTHFHCKQLVVMFSGSTCGWMEQLKFIKRPLMARYFTSIKLIFTEDEQQTLFKHDCSQHWINTDISQPMSFTSHQCRISDKKTEIKNKNLKLKNKKTTITLLMARLWGKHWRCKLHVTHSDQLQKNQWEADLRMSARSLLAQHLLHQGLHCFHSLPVQTSSGPQLEEESPVCLLLKVNKHSEITMSDFISSPL